jgi:hypothetical protein
MSKRMHDIAKHESDTSQEPELSPVQDTLDKIDTNITADGKDFKTHRAFNSLMVTFDKTTNKTKKVISLIFSFLSAFPIFGNKNKIALHNCTWTFIILLPFQGKHSRCTSTKLY